MYGVVNEGGTGAAARIEGVEFSGKTGSAQRVSNDLRKSGVLDSDEDKDNGWFVGFAPRQNPEIVVAVLLEGGEHGALAAPVARDVIKSYFDKKLRISQASPLLTPCAAANSAAKTSRSISYVTLGVGFTMATTRTHVILPAEVLREIDALVGQRGRSAFLAEVAQQEVRRRKLLAVLGREEPAWKPKDHPELKRGAAAWVSKMRRSEQKLRDKR